MTNKTKSQEYIPGVCNIGPSERKKRRLSGLIAGLTSAILYITLISINAPRAWRLILVITLFGSTIGYLQDAFHFCVGFGLKGLYNVISSAGNTNDVTTAEYRLKDRHKALSIIRYSLVISVVITFLCFIS